MTYQQALEQAENRLRYYEREQAQGIGRTEAERAGFDRLLTANIESTRRLIAHYETKTEEQQ